MVLQINQNEEEILKLNICLWTCAWKSWPGRVDQTAIIERVTKSQKAKCAQTIESLNPVQVLSWKSLH